MYTVRIVEQLLKNYVGIRAYLDISASPVRTSLLTGSRPVQAVRERPLGLRAGDETWPFMEVPHAVTPRDGKKRARSVEDIHCGVIDLEHAIAKLSPHDYALIKAYYVEGGRTFEELAVEFGYQGRDSVCKTCRRVLHKLVRIMENDLYDVAEV